MIREEHDLQTVGFSASMLLYGVHWWNKLQIYSIFFSWDPKFGPRDQQRFGNRSGRRCRFAGTQAPVLLTAVRGRRCKTSQNISKPEKNRGIRWQHLPEILLQLMPHFVLENLNRVCP